MGAIGTEGIPRDAKKEAIWTLGPRLFPKRNIIIGTQEEPQAFQKEGDGPHASTAALGILSSGRDTVRKQLDKGLGYQEEVLASLGSPFEKELTCLLGSNSNQVV